MEQKERVLVIAGAWNTQIFSPEWITENLVGKEKTDKLKVEYRANFDRLLSKTYHLGKMHLELSPNRICFLADPNDSETLDLIIEYAEKIVTLLPHTPFGGFGVNFQYSEKFEERIEDGLKAIDCYEIKEYVRKLTYTDSVNNKITIHVNLKPLSEKEETVVNFNIHYNVATSIEVKKYLTYDLFQRSKDLTIDFLERLRDELS